MDQKIVGKIKVSRNHQLIKRQALLTLVGIQNEHASYAIAPDDDPYDAVDFPEVYVSANDFRAMGEPQRITVTIEPGDQMNGTGS